MRQQKQTLDSAFASQKSALGSTWEAPEKEFCAGVRAADDIRSQTSQRMPKRQIDLHVWIIIAAIIALLVWVIH